MSKKTSNKYSKLKSLFPENIYVYDCVQPGVVPLTGKIPGQSPLYPWERGEPYLGRGALSQATMKKMAQQSAVYGNNGNGSGGGNGGGAFGSAGRASLGRMDGLR